MVLDFVRYISEQASYSEIYLITVFYFLWLYFGLGFLFLKTCEFLENRKLLSLIVASDSPTKNRKFELKHSLVSIFIFGFSGIAMVFLIRNGSVILLSESITNTLIGVAILTLYNEVHFFIVHKIMHLPFFYRSVHQIHHRSKVPSVYSVYSFHWFEALLLSTVPLTIAPFYSFSATAIFAYPLASILLNFAGHCNYRFSDGNGFNWTLFGTRHAQHHYLNTKRYGFATDVLDWLFSANKNQK